MKRFKRLIAMLLSLVMLTGVLPLGVFAEELQQSPFVTSTRENGVIESDPIPLPETLPLGTKTVQVQAGQRKELKFVPEEDGLYFFSSVGDTDTRGYLYNADRELITESDDDGADTNFAILWNLTAGKTYYLQVEFFNPEESGTVTLSTFKKLAATSIFFRDGQKSKVQVNNYLYQLFVEFGPENAAAEEVYYTSSNPEVLSCAGSGVNDPEAYSVAYLYPRSEGTATVTATTAGGLEATFDVTVLPATPFENGSTYPESDDVFGTVLAVSAEEGIYHFSFNASENTDYHWDLYDAFGFMVPSDSNAQYHLEDGTYYLAFYLEGESSAKSLTVNCTERTAATALTITDREPTGYVGEQFYPYFAFSPENAIYESVTVTSDNPEVAAYDPETDNIVLLSAGTANITVTSENGLTDTVLLTVSDAPPVEWIELEMGNEYKAIPGTSIEAYAWQYPDHCQEEPLTWTSDDPSVMTVTYEENENYAVLNFLKEGTVTLTVSVPGGVKAECLITVEEVSGFTDTTTVALSTDGEVQKVRFTPAVGGWYRIEPTAETQNDYYYYLYDSNMNWLCSSSYLDLLNFDFTAGEDYYVEIEPRYEREDSFVLGATKLVPATGFSLNASQAEILVRNNCTVSPVFTPENAIPEEVYYATTDTDVTMLEQMSNMGVSVHGLKAGSATVNASTLSGMSDSVEILVKEPPALVLNQKTASSVSSDADSVLKFTPQESGFYRFNLESGDYYCWHWLTDENDNSFFHEGGVQFDCTVTLEAGVTYYLISYFDDEEESGAISVTVTKPTPPTSLKITSEYLCGFTGEDRILEYSFEPKGCYEEDVVFTSSNPEILSFDENGYSYCDLNTSGTVTVTATSESGLTDSVTFTVLAPQKLTLNTDLSADLIEMEENSYYTILEFTPSEDGFYSLEFTGGNGLEYICDDLGVQGYVEGSSDQLNLQMEQDVSYRISLYSQRNYAKDPILKITEAVEIESLEILSLPDHMDYYEGFCDFQFYGLRIKAVFTDHSEAEWAIYEDQTLGGYPVDVYNTYDENDVYSATKITCGGKSTEFSFRILENPVKKLELVQGTAVTYLEHYEGVWEDHGSSKWFYYYTVYPYDAVLKVIYKDGSEKTVGFEETPDLHYSFDWNSNQYDTHWKVGTNDAEITYLGQSVTLPITVLSSPVESLEAIGEVSLYEKACGHDNEDYFYYNTNFLQKINVKITYKDGSSETVPCMDEKYASIFMISDEQYEKPWQLGDDNLITISYAGVSCTIPVTILPNPIDHIQLLNPPTPEYYLGDEKYGYWDGEDYCLSQTTKLEGLSIRVHYTNGSYEDVTFEQMKDQLNELDVSSLPVEEGPHGIGTHQSEFSYMGKTLTYDVRVVASPVASLEVTKLPANVREIGWQYPDVRGTEITVHFANGTHKIAVFDRENTRITPAGYPNFTVKLDGEDVIIRYNYGLEEWIAEYLGAAVTVDIPFIPTPDIEKVELLTFKKDVKGTVIRVTYVDKTSETVTLGESYSPSLIAIDSKFAETEQGLASYYLEDHTASGGYHVFTVAGRNFIILEKDLSNVKAGDVNGDDVLDMDDAIHLLFYYSFPDGYPVNQPVDFDGNGVFDMDDAIYLLFHYNFPDGYPLH